MEERYHYNSNGKLSGFSSDKSPLQRGCAKLAMVIGIPFLIILYILSPHKGERTAVQKTEAISSPHQEIQNSEYADNPDDTAMAPGNSAPSDSAASIRGAEQDAQTSPNEEDGEALPLDKIEAAMQEAFQKGKPARWKGNGFKGYAVPSDAQAETGCRSIYYSIDSRADWQSSTQEYCP